MAEHYLPQIQAEEHLIFMHWQKPWQPADIQGNMISKPVSKSCCTGWKYNGLRNAFKQESHVPAPWLITHNQGRADA